MCGQWVRSSIDQNTRGKVVIRGKELPSRSLPGWKQGINDRAIESGHETPNNHRALSCVTAMFVSSVLMLHGRCIQYYIRGTNNGRVPIKAVPDLVDIVFPLLTYRQPCDVILILSSNHPYGLSPPPPLIVRLFPVYIFIYLLFIFSKIKHRETSMSGQSSSKAPFFSFGPDDSFISKSSEGLR